MNPIVVSVKYDDNISYSDIRQEIGHIFGYFENETVNDFILKNDVRWDYDNYSFTDNTYYNVKFIGLSRIDGSLMYRIENTIPENLTVSDMFSYFNYSFKTLNTKLSFKEYVRKIKISSHLNNEPIPKKYRINTLPIVTLISHLEDHITKIGK